MLKLRFDGCYMHARLRSSYQMWQLQRMVPVAVCRIVWCHMYSPVDIALFNLYPVWYLFKHMVSLIVQHT